MTILGIPAVILLMTVPGLCLYSLLADKFRQSFSLAERWTFILGTSVVVTTLIMVIFLMIDIFPIELLVAVYVLWLIIWIIQKKIPWQDVIKSSTAIKKKRILDIITGLAVFIFLALLFCQPTEYYFGGRDPGIYVNTGVQISRLGRLKVEDSLIQEIADKYADIFIDKFEKFIGVFTERQGNTYYTNPQFFHAYSAWLAAGHRLLGFDGFLYITPILGLISMLILYTAVSSLWNKRTGFLTIVLLGLNIAQIWYARGPYSEILSQLLIWFSILTAVRAWQFRSSILGIVAGLAVGTALLVRLDNIFIAVPIGLLLIFILAYDRGKIGKWIWSFIISIGITYGIFVFYVLKFSREYTRDLLIVQSPVPDSFTLEMLFLVLGLLGAGGVIIVILLRNQWNRLFKWIKSKRKPLALGIGVGLIIIFGWLYFIRPLTPTPDLLPEGDRTFREESLIRLGWYISPLGILLALGGFVDFIYREFKKQHIFPVLFILTFCTLYLYDPRIYPDHFWAVRRYVPVIIPAFTLFTAYALDRIWQGNYKNITFRPISLVAVILLSIFLVYEAKPFLKHTEYRGSREGMESLASFFDENDIIISWDVNFTSRLAGTPLYFMYGKDVLTLGDTFNGENLAKFIQDKQKQGRDIYFLLSFQDVNITGNSFYLKYKDSVNFKLVNTEVTTDRKPRNISSWIWKVNIYEPVIGLMPWKEGVIDIGNLEDINYRMEGFYDEESNDREDYRWSGTKALIEIPLGKERDIWNLKKIVIRGKHFIPLDIHSEEVKVVLNGQPIGKVDMTEEFQEYVLEIPNDLLKNSNSITLELITNTWNPKELGISSDTRDLGVAIDYIMIK